MLKKSIFNGDRHYKYYLAKNGNLSKNLNDFLMLLNINKSSLDAHEENSRHYIQRPDSYKCVIDEVYPIPPRTRWLFEKNKFTLESKKSATEKTYQNNKSLFLRTIEKYKQFIGDKKIAIELSGGLDTAIIIGLCQSINIEPVLIGAQSNRYEFRTEKFIQNIQKQYSRKSILIDAEKTMPFIGLIDTPVHALPSTASIFYKSRELIAKECQKEDIQILLSGVGGDALLCPPFEKDFPQTSYKWMLDDLWADANIFSNYGCSYISAFSLSIFPKIFWNLRREQAGDDKKMWARNYFERFIPKELVSYSYKAGFDGMYHDSLQQSKKEILYMANLVHNQVQIEELSVKNISAMIDDTVNLSHDDMVSLMARISFINWIHALIRDKLI